jgi:hypothetical protein
MTRNDVLADMTSASPNGARSSRRPNPLALAWAVRHMATMWCVALQRFRDHLQSAQEHDDGQ